MHLRAVIEETAVAHVHPTRVKATPTKPTADAQHRSANANTATPALAACHHHHAAATADCVMIATSGTTETEAEEESARSVFRSMIASAESAKRRENARTSAAQIPVQRPANSITATAAMRRPADRKARLANALQGPLIRILAVKSRSVRFPLFILPFQIPLFPAKHLCRPPARPPLLSPRPREKGANVMSITEAPY